jgi:cytochrome c oxidase subunit IV
MTILDIILILLAVIFLPPIVSYMVMKFGVVGYLRGKYRHLNKSKDRKEDESDQ